MIYRHSYFLQCLFLSEKKGDRNSFFEYMDGYIKKPPEKLEENTLKKYRTTLSHLKKFRKQIYFPDIDNLLMRLLYVHANGVESSGCRELEFMPNFKLKIIWPK